MSSVRQAVENYFGISKNTFRLFQQPKSLKIFQSPVGANYLVSCHLLNILTILRNESITHIEFSNSDAERKTASLTVLTVHTYK